MPLSLSQAAILGSLSLGGGVPDSFAAALAGYFLLIMGARYMEIINSIPGYGTCWYSGPTCALASGGKVSATQQVWGNRFAATPTPHQMLPGL